MNIKQYQYILAVTELKNFGLAAEKCFITQSTLSTMIARFENEIGVKIFDRKTKPISITQEGEIIIDQLNVIEKEIDLLNEKVQSIKGEWTGDLKIGVIPTIAPYLLPEFLTEFVAKFPKITFNVSEMTTEMITDLIEKRELDIGILALPLDNKHLIEIPIYDESFVLYDCSDTENSKHADLESIDFSKFWLLSEGHCLHNQVNNICDLTSSKKDNINFNFNAGSIESLIRFVKTNQGITLLPSLACREFLSSEIKKVKYFKKPIPVRTVGLVVHRNFVKQQLLEVLKKDIHDKISPLLKKQLDSIVVSPLR